jgi:hypothetical protein
MIEIFSTAGKKLRDNEETAHIFAQPFTDDPIV